MRPANQASGSSHTAPGSGAGRTPAAARPAPAARPPVRRPGAPGVPGAVAGGTAGAAPAAGPSVLGPSPGRALRDWLNSQAVNAARSLRLLRDFRPGEFGTSAAAPSDAHLHATNRLLAAIRGVVGANAAALTDASNAAMRRPDRAALDRVAQLKDEGAGLIAQAEKIWHIFAAMFAQRQGRMAGRLLAADRIALDCYQYVYQGLGRARPIPAPPPLSYMEAGSGPATYRRGVRLAKLGLFPNPFPVVKIPDHRLVSPWTLGAIPHEVAHNLQADLGLWQVVPRRLAARLAAIGLPRPVVGTWVRWQKEIFADLLSVLLIGPAYIGSLMDVVGRSPSATVGWSADGVHPTPFLRVLINLELLHRMGFAVEARACRKAWLTLYPADRATPIPPDIRRHFVRAARETVSVLVDQPYAELGDRTLRQVVAFRRQDQQVAEEAAARLARGADPGIVPERFLLAAVRHAFDRGLADPATLTRNFYQSLGRR